MQPDALTSLLADPQTSSRRTPKQRRRDFRRDVRRRRRITERIAADPTLTDCTKTVALAALRYSDDTAKPAFPSMGAIAEAASCQRRSARRCIVDLIEAGYIKRIERPMAARRNATNLYYFREPPGQPPAHREGQRRRPRRRLGRDPQNCSSDRRTRETSEPAEQLPNRLTPGPGYPQPPAHRSKTRAKTTVRPGPAVPAVFLPVEPIPEADPELVQASLRAARERLHALKTP